MGRLGRFVRITLAVADADAAAVEAAVMEIGQSRRWLAPVAWAAGTLVLFARGIKLLVLNPRLALLELGPAAWVWLVMWDVKQHALRTAHLRQASAANLVLLACLAIAATTLVLCCNTAFAFAIIQTPPRLRPALRMVRLHLARVVAAGFILGALTALGVAGIPRISVDWLYALALLALYAAMLVTFVAVPASALGSKRRRLSIRQLIGRYAAIGALSAVAMTPGFVLDRVGLILLGFASVHIIGLAVLTIGVALYAAGLSSVKAVSLSAKLSVPSAQPVAEGSSV